MQMFGQMPGMMGVYGLLYLVAVVAVVIALWRGMRAQETMARHLAAIERSLTEHDRGERVS